MPSSIVAATAENATSSCSAVPSSPPHHRCTAAPLPTPHSTISFSNIRRIRHEGGGDTHHFISANNDDNDDGEFDTLVEFVDDDDNGDDDEHNEIAAHVITAAHQQTTAAPHILHRPSSLIHLPATEGGMGGSSSHHHSLTTIAHANVDAHASLATTATYPQNPNTARQQRVHQQQQRCFVDGGLSDGDTDDEDDDDRDGGHEDISDRFSLLVDFSSDDGDVEVNDTVDGDEYSFHILPITGGDDDVDLCRASEEEDDEEDGDACVECDDCCDVSSACADNGGDSYDLDDDVRSLEATDWGGGVSHSGRLRNGRECQQYLWDSAASAYHAHAAPQQHGFQNDHHWDGAEEGSAYSTLPVSDCTPFPAPCHREDAEFTQPFTEAHTTNDYHQQRQQDQGPTTTTLFVSTSGRQHALSKLDWCLRASGILLEKKKKAKPSNAADGDANNDTNVADEYYSNEEAVQLCRERYPYRTEHKPFPPKPTRPSFPSEDLIPSTRVVKCCYYSLRPARHCGMGAKCYHTHDDDDGDVVPECIGDGRDRSEVRGGGGAAKPLPSSPSSSSSPSKPTPQDDGHDGDGAPSSYISRASLASAPCHYGPLCTLERHRAIAQRIGFTLAHKEHYDAYVEAMRAYGKQHALYKRAVRDVKEESEALKRLDDARLERERREAAAAAAAEGATSSFHHHSHHHGGRGDGNRNASSRQHQSMGVSDSHHHSQLPMTMMTMSHRPYATLPRHHNGGGHSSERNPSSYHNYHHNSSHLHHHNQAEPFDLGPYQSQCIPCQRCGVRVLQQHQQQQSNEDAHNDGAAENDSSQGTSPSSPSPNRFVPAVTLSHIPVYKPNPAYDGVTDKRREVKRMGVRCYCTACAVTFAFDDEGQLKRYTDATAAAEPPAAAFPLPSSTQGISPSDDDQFQQSRGREECDHSTTVEEHHHHHYDNYHHQPHHFDAERTGGEEAFDDDYLPW